MINQKNHNLNLSRKKVFKALRKFSRIFGYSYKQMKNTFIGLDENKKKEYLKKMYVFMDDYEQKKFKEDNVSLNQSLSDPIKYSDPLR